MIENSIINFDPSIRNTIICEHYKGKCMSPICSADNHKNPKDCRYAIDKNSDPEEVLWIG